MNKFARVLVPAGAALAAVAARAADGGAVDVSSTVTTITAQLAPIALIGAAVLGVVVAIKAFHWVKRAIS